MDVSRVYVRALALACFYSHISTQTFRRGADRVGGQLRGDKECPFSGVTKSGRVWRKVPKTMLGVWPYAPGAPWRHRWHTPSHTAFRHLPPNSARFSYATEGALFISAQLSSNAVTLPSTAGETETAYCTSRCAVGFLLKGLWCIVV